MRLLIVDDEVWSRQLIKKLLPWNDYGFSEVLEAPDGEVAIELLDRHPIELTITDMRMPGVDGAMLLQHLREVDHPTEVIVMSAYEDYKYLHEALKTKAIDYLLKPVVKQQLEQAVRLGLERIQETRSHSMLDSLLHSDAFQTLFHRYYELRNNLFVDLVSMQEPEVERHLDKIHSLLQEEQAAPIHDYICQDLNRLVTKLERENHVATSYDKTVDLTSVRHRLLHLIGVLQGKHKGGSFSILDVQTYIDNHHTDVITLQNIAATFFVSKEHLGRVFKQEVGTTVQQYVTMKKIDHAKQLLRRYDSLSIQAISMMVGYLDLPYFYRVFKKQTGLTPVQYRAQTSILYNQ